MDYTTSKFLKVKKRKNHFKSFLSKVLICILIFLVMLIISKSNKDLSDKIYHYVYENNFSFSKIYNLCQEYLGGVLPLDTSLDTDTTTVFTEVITYSELEEIDNGVKLNVGDNYLIPVIESGIVVYIGEKEDYGKTVIIQQIDGVDTWYSNVTSNVALYDYVEKGSLMGSTNSKYLYLYFEENGEFINYQIYI